MTDLLDESTAARTALTRRLVDDYTSGRSLSSLSAEVGRSYGYVRRLILDAGVTLRPRGGSHARP